MKKLIGLIFLILIFNISCRREWDNPFDPDCPKEFFTPSDFQASLVDNTIKLTWSQGNTNISGFKIERKVGNEVWEVLVSLDNTVLTWNDTLLIGEKLYEYRIYAFAGENESNLVSIQFNQMLNLVVDIEGNIYHTVTIGTQVWMADNLKTTKYRDGISIPNVTDNTTWANLTSGAFCWYDNLLINKDKYGALYNWYSVSNGKLCPSGWHVPSFNEWTILEQYLGTNMGGKIRSLSGWDGFDNLTTNSSGFSGLPGGYRQNDFFTAVGNNGNWWTTSEATSSTAYRYWLLYNSYGFDHIDKKLGFSVRCLKD